jgi:hypothetical protein|nr:MAG TPA: protein of unknown function (DUF3127) [Caudoviricetes sp.]
MAEENKQKISGRIIAVMQMKTGTSQKGTWASQEYVLETHDSYPQKVCFEVFGTEKIQQFNIQMNDEVDIMYNFDAREFKGRWYNTIRAWSVFKRSGGGQTQVAAQSSGDVPKASEAVAQDNGISSELPF